MRVTITLDDDVTPAVEQFRRERSLGLSEAVNELIRAGLTFQQPRTPYRHRSERMGLRIDASKVAAAIETLDGPASR